MRNSIQRFFVYLSIVGFGLLACSQEPKNLSVIDIESALNECLQIPDPKPLDSSSQAKGKSLADGILARSTCRDSLIKNLNLEQRTDEDIKKIREILQKNELALDAQRKKEERMSKDLTRGFNAPIKEYKY